MTSFQSKRNQRAISMQDMAETLAKKARESRSVSFNGVSVMVDAALKWSNVSKERKTQISVAVNENKIDVLRYVFSVTHAFHGQSKSFLFLTGNKSVQSQ